MISVTLQGQTFIAEKTKNHKDSLLIYGYIREMISNQIDPDIVSNLCFSYFTSKEVVIKTANKLLYETNIKRNDDIAEEAKLYLFFMANDPPLTLIKYNDFFHDDNYFYLILEKGGKDLFEFVVECHEYIKDGILSLKEWKKTVRFIFSKMIEFIHWMHTVAHCCNLDISLENIVMAKETFFDRESGTFRNLGIKFIDFGCSEHFDEMNTEFICNKFVGKTLYQSPQIFEMETFRANKTDIWSLGICLFLMTIGAPPYNKPSKTDPAFEILMDNKMISLLQRWGRLEYIGKNQYDLLMKMLCFDEKERISIEDIMKHQWIRDYFDEQIKPKSIKKKKKKMRTPSIIESKTFISGVLNDDIYANIED